MYGVIAASSDGTCSAGVVLVWKLFDIGVTSLATSMVVFGMKNEA